MRNLLLYSPAVVCALWAVVIALFGRSDGLTVGGAAALAVALVLHTWQEVRQGSDRGLV